nr:hypothetical protein [Mesorhizobium sp.]
MQALFVVDPLDEFADPLPGIDDIAIGSTIDLFLLQRSHEALSLAPMRCAASRAAYSAQAPCTPRSLWWMTLPDGGRLLGIAGTAQDIIQVRADEDARSPSV